MRGAARRVPALLSNAGGRQMIRHVMQAPKLKETPMDWIKTNDGYVCGNAQIADNGGGVGPATGSGRWAVMVDGTWHANIDTLDDAKEYAEAKLTPSIPVEGALDPALQGSDRALTAQHPFQLGIITTGGIDEPRSLEPGHPSWFSAPRFAKAAGAALNERHPETLGYDVLKVDRNGNWRTAHTEVLAERVEALAADEALS